VTWTGEYDTTTPYTHTIPHPYYQPALCLIVVTAMLDNGSGTAAKAKVQIWSCTGKRRRIGR